MNYLKNVSHYNPSGLAAACPPIYKISQKFTKWFKEVNIFRWGKID